MQNVRLLILLLGIVMILPISAQKLTNQPVKGFWTNQQNNKSSQILRNCYTVQMEQQLQSKYPDRLREEEFEHRMAQMIDTKRAARLSTSDQLYQIPTIVHVVHNGESIGTDANISQEQVMSQFDVLNEDFRRMGAGFNDHPDGADILVEFVPVKFDPSGNELSEPGIHRYDGGQDFWGEFALESELKPGTIWDPEKYFNIWVVNFGGDLDGVLGYAQFPSMSGLDGLSQNEGVAETDGVVIGYQFFGSTGNVQAPYNLGRTTTHEVGHWLGLRHIWGDGGCDIDDYCADTPPAADANYECSEIDSCPGDSKNDMIENYMDYTNDACMNIFTQDQKERMRIVLETSPRRKTLTSLSCLDAVSITAGTYNATPSAWYTYTATENQVVTISSVGSTTEDTNLIVFDDCTSDEIVIVDDVLGTLQSEFSHYLLIGESLNILWDARHSDVAFDWTLATTAASDGAACGLAITALAGTNNVAATNAKTVWYAFNMTEANSKISLTLPQKTAHLFAGQCDRLEYLESVDDNANVVTIAQGETLYMAVEVDGGGFNFDIAVSTLAEGEACSTARSISNGSFTAPEENYWYRYTSTGFGNMYVTSEYKAEVSIYDQCDGKLLVDGTLEGDTVWLVVRDQQELQLFLEFDPAVTVNDWTIGLREFVSGEVCETAIDVDEGTVNSLGAPIWYRYVASKDGTVTISSRGLTNEDTFVAVFSGCSEEELITYNDDIDYENGNFQSEVVIPSAKQGDEIYIYWIDEYSNAEFRWSVSIRDEVPGEFCENAKQASIGQNSASEAPNGLMWFVFTPTEANKKLTISSSASDYVYFVETDCIDLEIKAAGAGEAVLVDYTVDEKIYIVWEASSDFNWELSYEELAPGNLCETALTAEIGNNTSGSLPAWYRFVMPDNGSLKITSVGTTNEDTFLAIYDGCGGDLIAGNDDLDFDGGVYQSEVILYDLLVNSEILIAWEPAWSSSSFTWKLELYEPAEGESCSTAKVINHAGIVTGARPPYWYTHTMSKDGDLRISSVGHTSSDTYLVVLDACGDDAMILGENDDASGAQSEVLLENLMAGEQVMIYWSDDYSSSPFSWELEILNSINKNPTTSDYNFEIIPETLEGDVIGTIAGLDEDGDLLKYFFTSGSNEFFELGEDNGELKIIDLQGILNMPNQFGFQVSVSDGVGSVESNVTITLNVLGLEDDEFNIYPNPTADRIHISLEGNKHDGGTIIDMSGRLREKIKMGEIDIPVSQLGSGIYFIRLNIDGRFVQSKFIVE